MGAPFRTNIRTYRDSFQGIGCGAGCVVHLVLIGLIGVGMLVWLIKIRAWELSVTVELPAVKKAEGEVAEPMSETERPLPAPEPESDAQPKTEPSK